MENLNNTKEKLETGNEEQITVGKFDDLNSLEAEIAKMHNVEPTIVKDTSISLHLLKANDVPGRTHNERQVLEHKNGFANIDQKQENSINEIDLIAMLKGTDAGNESLNTCDGTGAGVTIEGEGQYEIMEIIDSDDPAESNIDVSPKKINKACNKTPMSPAQARKLALEQIEGLKSRRDRRKQEFKTNLSTDILTTVNKEWHECDFSVDDAAKSKEKSEVGKADVHTQASKIVTLKAMNLETQQSIVSPKVKIKNLDLPQLNQQQQQIQEQKPKLELPESNNANNNTPTLTLKRVIKRKIIWDPDVPETKKSYAQYATTKRLASSDSPSLTKEARNSATPTAAQRSRSLTPAILKSSNASKLQAKLLTTDKHKRINEQFKASDDQLNKRSETPFVPPSMKRKKPSELDRLLGDEGAANMVQAVKQLCDITGEMNSPKPTMRRRAYTITERPATTATAFSPIANKEQNQPKKRSPAPRTRRPSNWANLASNWENDDEMIARRRSNSSHSSNASANLDKNVLFDGEPTSGTNNETKDFEFIRPKINQKGCHSSASLSMNTITTDLKLSTRDSIVIKIYEKLAHLEINTEYAKIPRTFTVELFKKLSDTLGKLSKAGKVNAILMTSKGSQFCHGVDFHDLASDKIAIEHHNSYAHQLANAMKSYLKILATCPKPIIIGINGNMQNFGVMQLPLYDVIVCSDKSTFQTSYGKIGQIPEGLCLFNSTQKVATTVKTRLFLLCDKLNVREIGGLIYKTISSDKLGNETFVIAKNISDTSADTYRYIKKKTNGSVLKAISGLEDEFKIIVGQWMTLKCQEHFKNYIRTGQF